MGTKGLTRCGIATTLAAATLISTGSLASPTTYVTAITGANSPSASDGDLVLQAVGTSAGYAAVADSANATSSVTVGFGWARGSAVASAGQEDSSAQASVQGMWVDQLIFSAPGVSGAGVATVRFDVSGNLSASSGGTIMGSHAEADWNLYFKSDASGAVTQLTAGSGQINANPSATTSSGDTHGGSYFVAFDFYYNVPVDVRVALNVSAQAQHAGDATGLFGNTLEWGGITELLDNTGNVLADFSVAGDSGVDWAHAVSAPTIPIPAGLWLLVTGMLALVPAIRRR